MSTQFTLLFEEHFVKLLTAAKQALSKEPEDGVYVQGELKVVMERWGWECIEDSVRRGLLPNAPEDREEFDYLGWTEKLFLYRQEWARRRKMLNWRVLFVDWDEDDVGPYDTSQWVVVPSSVSAGLY